jgi:hypothetical protein
MSHQQRDSTNRLRRSIELTANSGLLGIRRVIFYCRQAHKNCPIYGQVCLPAMRAPPESKKRSNISFSALVQYFLSLRTYF